MQRQEPVQQASEQPVRQALPEPIVLEQELAREPQASGPEQLEPVPDLRQERERRQVRVLQEQPVLRPVRVREPPEPEPVQRASVPERLEQELVQQASQKPELQALQSGTSDPVLRQPSGHPCGRPGLS